MKGITRVRKQKLNSTVSSAKGTLPSAVLDVLLTPKNELSSIKEKYQLLYLLILTHFFFHIIIYHAINMFLHNAINEVFLCFYSNSSDNYSNKNPFNLASSMFSGVGPNIFSMTQGNSVFSHAMNLIKCLTNILTSVFFHGLYCAVLYSSTT